MHIIVLAWFERKIKQLLYILSLIFLQIGISGLAIMVNSFKTNKEFPMSNHT